MELNKTKLIEYLIGGLMAGFIFSLFFPIRTLIDSPNSTVLGYFSDFTAFWLYLSDIFVFLLFALGLATRAIKINKNLLWWLTGIAIFLTFLAYISDFQPNNIYWLIKSVEFILVFVIFVNFSLIYEDFALKIAKLFIIFTISQVLLAFFQNITGHSLGLYILGESHLSTTWYQVAKVVAHGTTYLRGYGTFPHPNVLSAYIFTAILLNIYLLHHVVERKPAYFWRFSLVFLVFGLFSTFSRGAVISTVIGLTIIITFIELGITESKRAKRLIFPIFTTLFGLFVVIALIFTPRGGISDESITERSIYNQIALDMIKDRPLSGVGVGESMLHMEQYSQAHLETWQVQPIHNYFLLTASEGGILLALSLLSIFLYYLIKLGRSIWNTVYDDRKFFRLILLSILVGYLFLMQFDHYFYTLQQTQILLWLILGLIAAELKRTREIKKILSN